MNEFVNLQYTMAFARELKFTVCVAFYCCFLLFPVSWNFFIIDRQWEQDNGKL